MKIGTVQYAVIESDTNGIKKDLSHWLFKSYDAAIKFAAEMTASNDDEPQNYTFTVISLMEQ